MAGEPADRGRLVDLLERLTAAEGSVDLADDDEHRRRVLAGRVDPDRQVRGADGSGPECRSRSTSELAVGFGHERRGAFVADRDDADAGGLESFQETEEALARHGEGVANPGGAKGIGDESPDGPRAGLGRLGRRLVGRGLARG